MYHKAGVAVYHKLREGARPLQQPVMPWLLLAGGCVEPGEGACPLQQPAKPWLLSEQLLCVCEPALCVK